LFPGRDGQREREAPPDSFAGKKPQHSRSNDRKWAARKS